MMKINDSRSVTTATLAALVGLFALGIAALPGTARSADDQAANNQARSAENPAITSLGWLTGVWETLPGGRGGQIDVTFEPARGGEIVSTFTSTAKGRITHYEMRTIRVQDGKVIFTEAAFGPGMKPLPAPPDRALVLADATHANFEGMTQILTGKDSMTTILTSKGRDGKTRNVKVEFRRVMRFSHD